VIHVRDRLLELLVGLLRRTPLRLADALAWGVAWTWWWVLPVRRAVAVANLRLALPELPPRPVLTRMLHDLALGYVEILQLQRGTVTFSVEGTVPAGSLVLAGHFGSFDLCLVAWSDVVPLALYIRPPADPWARRLIAGIRADHGLLTLDPGTQLADGYRALEGGRSLMFVQDQRRQKGVDSPLFGQPARTAAGFAAAVLRFGRPVHAVWQWRTGVGRHQIRVEPLTLPAPTGDEAADIQAITDATNRWYEARIRERPHGWFWLHRRWR
jgi:KDO2-lipid IV(A) lauroyltransferase